MNTIKNAERMEKLRKSRSLNDVVSVIKNIASDIGRSKNSVARMEAVASAETKGRRKVSTSAGKSRAIKINHDGIGDDIPIQKRESPSDIEKKGNRAVFRKKAPSNGIKIAKYTAPSVDTAEKVQNKIDIVHDLHENLVELDAAQEKIKHQFRGAKNLKVALAGIQALRDEIQATLTRAYSMIETIAQKHLPEPLSEMNEVLQEYLLENIAENKYEDMREEIFVTVKSVTDANEGVVTKGPKKIKIDINKADFAFHCYVVIDKLQNSGGYEFDEYCVVLTGVVDRNGVMRYFLNALPDFKAPGKFNIGQEVRDDDELTTRMAMLLAHNDVITELERKPMPLTTETAKQKGFHAIEGVEEVHVVDDSLRVTISKAKSSQADDKHKGRQVDIIKAQVRSLLNAVISRRSKSKVVPREAKDNKGRVVLVFSLIPDIPDTEEKKDYSLNVSKLRDLQHVLGLPEDVIEDVKKAMLHRV